MFSRDGSLLPSGYADARYVDAVVVSQAPIKPTTVQALMNVSAALNRSQIDMVAELGPVPKPEHHESRRDPPSCRESARGH